MSNTDVNILVVGYREFFINVTWPDWNFESSYTDQWSLTGDTGEPFAKPLLPVRLGSYMWTRSFWKALFFDSSNNKMMSFDDFVVPLSGGQQGSGVLLFPHKKNIALDWIAS